MTEPTNESVGRPGAGPRDEEEETPQGPVIRDRRRLDPETGQVRRPAPSTDDAPDPAEAIGQADEQAAAQGEDDLVTAQARSVELLGDLQRLNAEYVNYRKRVERDRDVARDTAVASVLESLLPVLDDIQLARQHGDLEAGPFASIAEKLEATLGKFGLERYGEVGQEFDPAQHEALMHTDAELAEGTTTTTVVQILQPGYRLGARTLRPARVAVADPA